MYSKSYILLFIVNIVCGMMLLFSKEYDVQAGSVCEQEVVVQATTGNVELERLASLERVISYGTLEQRFCIDVSDKDLETLFKIVEAEAGGEDRKGKLLVANVVINRVKNKKFPNNVTDVVYQQKQNVAQFSPVSNGTIHTGKVTEDTTAVVDCARRGEDVSEGALFFMARKYAAPENVQWFDSNLTFLFSYGGHDFFAK